MLPPGTAYVFCDGKKADISFDSVEDGKETSPFLTIDCLDDNIPGGAYHDARRPSSSVNWTDPKRVQQRLVHPTRSVLVTSISITTITGLMLMLLCFSTRDIYPEDSSRDTLRLTGITTAKAPNPGSNLWQRPTHYKHWFNAQHEKAGSPSIYAQATKAELEAKIERDRIKYLEETSIWKKYVWTPPRPHPSFETAIATLTEEEKILRIWIETLFHGVPARSVGLQANASDLSFEDLSWPLWPFPYPPDLSADRNGSDGKWARLRKHSLSPGDEGMCHQSDTLSKYHEIHRQMLMGEIPGEFIIYRCERNISCGGLADRMMGMLTAFYLALAHNRACLFEWQDPVPLEVFFESPRIDWAYSDFDDGVSYPALRDPELRSKAREVDVVNLRPGGIDKIFNTLDWSENSKARIDKSQLEALSSPWIDFYGNRGMILRSFDYAEFGDKPQELGLTWEDAYGCLLHYLFKPKPSLLSYIALYTSLFTLPTIFTVGIQVRTGDLSMASELGDAQNTVAYHQDYFRCAREIGETYALPSQKVLYYLVTDSNHLKVDAAIVLGDQLVMTDIRPGHVDFASELHEAADAAFGALSEFFILSKTDMRVQTEESGFGRIPTFASGLDNSSVIITAIWRRKKGKKYAIDCRRPESVTGFKKMCDNASLG